MNNQEETVTKIPLLNLILKLVWTAAEKVEASICLLFWGNLEVTSTARSYLLLFSFTYIHSSFILISLKPQRNMVTLISSTFKWPYAHLLHVIFFLVALHRTVVLSYCWLLPCQQRAASLPLINQVNKQRLQFYSILSIINSKI